MEKENFQATNPESIKGLFDSISNTYDTANDVMTLGMARNWRKQLVDWSEASEGHRVLDCATGTGDLAIEFKKAVGETGTVIGTDFCQGMLDKAPSKAKKEKVDVIFELADCMNLDYPEDEFDVTSIAYGVRNVANPKKAISEMARVTQPEGHVMILETGETETPLVKSFVNLYMKHIVPRLGGLVSGNRSAYEYLQDSSQKFPSGEDFVKLMESTGAFEKVEYRRIMGGASYIYKGTVK